MLGSDPIAALLGAGVDPRSPEVVLRGYLRALVARGCAIAMMGPDVVVPSGGLDTETQAALSKLTAMYPSTTLMPVEGTGKLAGLSVVDTTSDRINARVSAYFRHINKVVGKDRVQELREAGILTAGAGVHIGSSQLVAVIVPDAEALRHWRRWSAEVSGDRYEAHTAPTLLVPGYSGGGVYLFRTPSTANETVGTSPEFEPLGAVTMSVGASVIETGDLTVPIPPTQISGQPVMRLGPCRMLPAWLESQLRSYRNATTPAA